MNSLELARWCCSPETRMANDAVGIRARELLLDYLGVMIGGAYEEPSARAAIEYARVVGGSAQSSLLAGGGLRVSAENAAFAGATAGHSLEMDDVQNASSIHPAVVVIPAALAVAEEVGANGRAFLESIVAGYEVILRVGEAANPTALYAGLFHPTAVCGVFGAAAAAGRLMGLSSDQLAHAFGIAWGFASGNMSFQTEGSWLKRIQVGHASQAGIQAARLASLGAQGPLHVFEQHGFFQNYAGHFDAAKLLPRAGESPKLMEVSIKPYACCRYNQAPVDLALELRAEGIAHDQIESLDVRIASTGLPLVGTPIGRKRVPADQVEAQFSLPYSVSVALVAGAAGHREYREPWLVDARVRDLCKRVSVGASPDIDAMFPAKWPARITARLKNGATIEKFSTDCLGDPAKPLGREGIERKLLSLVEPAIGVDVAHQLIAAADRIDSAPNIASIAKILARPYGSG